MKSLSSINHPLTRRLVLLSMGLAFMLSNQAVVAQPGSIYATLDFYTYAVQSGDFPQIRGNEKASIRSIIAFQGCDLFPLLMNQGGGNVDFGGAKRGIGSAVGLMQLGTRMLLATAGGGSTSELNSVAGTQDFRPSIARLDGPINGKYREEGGEGVGESDRK